MSTPAHYSHRYARGFSLIEILVGMVIGLIGILVIMQVFAVFEGQKRTTTGGADAQNTGAIALYGIQRDIQASGYGISSVNIIGCDMLLRAGLTVSAFAPVTINHAAITGEDANTDTLLVAYSDGNSPQEGDGITAQPSTQVYGVQTPTSFNLFDRVAAQAQARPAPCSLIMDSVVGASPNVSVITGVAGMTNGMLYNLGQQPKLTAYAIRNGNLTACEYINIDPVTHADSGNNCGDATLNNDSNVWVPLANNIVSMKIEYGQDTSLPMDGIVDAYNQTTPTTACGWAQASAIRLVLVARNGQPDKLNVTAAAPAWTGSALTPVVLTATTVPAGFTWQNYRYKIFQTTVPIRNVVLAGAQLGC